MRRTAWEFRFTRAARKANEAAVVSTLSAIRIEQANTRSITMDRAAHSEICFDEGYLDKRFNYDRPHERGFPTHQAIYQDLQILGQFGKELFAEVHVYVTEPGDR